MQLTISFIPCLMLSQSTESDDDKQWRVSNQQVYLTEDTIPTER